MSLRTKILIILILVVALYISLNYVVQRFVVFPSFVALEQEERTHEPARSLDRPPDAGPLW